MKALVYNGPHKYALEDRPKPEIKESTDAIIKVIKSTICGTDLHILKGDVPHIPAGRILGHEGLGIVEQVGSSVHAFSPGDRVIISCITSCASCEFCRRGMLSHCNSGGWQLGHVIDGTQADFVRIRHADSSLYHFPTTDVDERELLMISDVLPTAYECGVLNGNVRSGGSVAIEGSGPVGLAVVLLIAGLYSPSKIISLDHKSSRLEVAKRLGATHTVESGPDEVKQVMEITGGRGVDTAIEAVGVPKTFEFCEEVIAPGGTIANIGVHGAKADLHLEKLWDRNITITTRLVDTVTTPTLLQLLASGRLDVKDLTTHTFKFADMEKAYQVFGAAAENKALKVVIDYDSGDAVMYMLFTPKSVHLLLLLPGQKDLEIRTLMVMATTVHAMPNKSLLTMKALVYNGPHKYALEDRPKPEIKEPTDAIIKLTKSTICGTDLHILKGDVPYIPTGRVMGHEGLGIVEQVGSSVRTFSPGDRVIISCVTACASCEFCRRGMQSHCTSGGWQFGNVIDGTQADYVRVLHADSSLYHYPTPEVDERALLMISDILPTAYECGVLNGNVRPGGSVAIVIVLDLDPNRLEVAKRFGATHIVESGPDAAKQVMEITGGRGVDTAIEAVGVPATFEFCQEIISPGGTIANIGVHGAKADLHLEKLWDRNITITTRLVDTVTTPTLIQLLASGRLNVKDLTTHTFKFADMEKAYQVFGAAAENKALKVVIDHERYHAYDM
ncbi:hypothetical protein EW146_g96 [Bondarzewia mesenterica]|uniref:Enoyl reductase (ER) domain-containing protein n=1 Tax=Bondarzewia mesenterica TaxID=1095465 RepID=A0A4S4M8C5_9AGAM|nr:hypothetical protein EW146_g96 [Bondarzewia mesenterica]